MKKDAEADVTVFLMADAVIGAKASQKTPDGYYNIERMLKRVLAGKGQVLLCATCMDARGLTDAEIMPGAKRSSMDELAAACWRPTRCWCSNRVHAATRARSEASSECAVKEKSDEPK